MTASTLQLLTLKCFQFIIDCPQKDLFHNFCDIIITSQMAVSEVVIFANVTVVIIYGSGFSPLFLTGRSQRVKWKTFLGFFNLLGKF